MINKKQFIDKILLRYMSNASEETANLIAQDYERLLPSTLDFDYLYDKICMEYTQRAVPQISQIKQWFKTAKEYENSNNDTLYTWKIIAQTKTGAEYEFHNFMNVPERAGIEAFRKNYPELIYLGNNYTEVIKYGY